MSFFSTFAAGGFRDRRFSVEDILVMQDEGTIDESDNFELIDGEIIPMNAKLHVHERIKGKLILALARACPDHLFMGVETSLFLSERTFVEPDICIYPESLQSDEVKAPDIVLAIEVAVSTLAYDLGRKAQAYARHGLRELWVIDAMARRTFIHRGASARGWARITEHGPDFELTIAAVPGFRLRLDAI